MGFEEWLKCEYGESWPGHNTRFMKAAYRAGLLHAAEQDQKIMDNIKKSGEGLTANAAAVAEGFSIAYKDSATMHRKAASEIK